MSDEPLAFASAAAFEAWLAEQHATSDGLWIKFARKASGIPTVVYAEAVEASLRYGWIDGQVKRLDDDHYVQRFTPRRARSRWSKINRAKAEALIASGAMEPAGLAEVERAKADGRWDAAYDAPSTATVPDDLRAALDRDRAASEFFETIDAQQPLRDPAPDPGGEEARDAGAQDREVRGDAEPRRDGSPAAPRGAVAAHLHLGAALAHRHQRREPLRERSTNSQLHCAQSLTRASRSGERSRSTAAMATATAGPAPPSPTRRDRRRQATSRNGPRAPLALMSSSAARLIAPGSCPACGSAVGSA